MSVRVLNALKGAIAAAGLVTAMSGLRAQLAGGDAAAPPAPRGQVTADCYARVELWQGDRRTPLRLLYTHVSYNETISAGVQSDLASAWNKFILPKVAEQVAQSGQNQIVYCQYADVATNTELARWPVAAPVPERVDWPGHSIAGEPPRTSQSARVVPTTLAPAVAPAMPSSAIAPAAAVAPQSSAEGSTAPRPPDSAARLRAILPPPQTGEKPAPADNTIPQPQDAHALNEQLVRRDEQRRQIQQSRDEAYRQQMEEYQRRLAVTNAAHDAFDQQQRQYQREKADYEAKYAKPRK